MEETPKKGFKLDLISAIVIGVVLISLGLVLSGVSSEDVGIIGQAKVSVVNKNPEATPDPSKKVDVEIGDDPVLGSPDAPITVIEFSDYQCPFCRTFWTNWLPDLKEKYIDQGIVKLVYKDFPLDSIHPMAAPYALAANCAEDQGKYWEMHDRIFEEQAKFGTGTVSHLTGDDTKAWAADMGLNMTEFNSCFDSKKYNDEIYDDLQYGSSLGVRGTPTFFVNGRIVPGLLNSFAAFEEILNGELE